MTFKRVVGILLILVVLGTGVIRPAPARADTGTDFAIAGLAIAAWAAIVVTGTLIAYRNAPPLPQALAAGDLTYDAPSAGVQVGPRWEPESKNVSLVRW